MNDRIEPKGEFLRRAGRTIPPTGRSVQSETGALVAESQWCGTPFAASRRLRRPADRISPSSLVCTTIPRNLVFSAPFSRRLLGSGILTPHYDDIHADPGAGIDDGLDEGVEVTGFVETASMRLPRLRT
jgi:hypothetical protein